MNRKEKIKLLQDIESGKLKPCAVNKDKVLIIDEFEGKYYLGHDEVSQKFIDTFPGTLLILRAYPGQKEPGGYSLL